MALSPRMAIPSDARKCNELQESYRYARQPISLFAASMDRFNPAI